jgi:hypothetical protein
VDLEALQKRAKRSKEEINMVYRWKDGSKVKVKQSLYTPWRRLGGEEV